MHTYEIYLAKARLSAELWQEFFGKLADFCGLFGGWSLQVALENSTVYFYLKSRYALPAGIGGENFLLKPITSAGHNLPPARVGWSRFMCQNDNLLDIANKLQRRSMEFVLATMDFAVCGKRFFNTTSITFRENGKLVTVKLPFRLSTMLLAIDFANYAQYTYRHFPKCLQSGKSLKLLTAEASGAVLLANVFPYESHKHYLKLKDYDFFKHSLVLGGSGAGKSKFMVHLIRQIQAEYPDKYKVVVIDPHDALKEDFLENDDCKVVDFMSDLRSIDLFAGCLDDIGANVELMLTTFQSLMAENYNSYTDRVLRYVSFLLIQAKKFSFAGLRKVLTDVEYRNTLVNEQKNDLPESVMKFFLGEYNTLHTQHYDAAIAPLVAFVDEMQMVPVFSNDEAIAALLGCIQQSFLNIFSLSRPKMGTKVVKMIAGLLLQQLFIIAQKMLVSEHLIVVIDEVAIVENPILTRFLAELRKYGVSVILAGQYFAQFSAELRSAIYANVSNYYIFRVSRDDAEDLVQNLNLKLLYGDSLEARAKLLSGLKLRECVVQLSAGDTVYPAFQARVPDVEVVKDDSKDNEILYRTFHLAAPRTQYVATNFSGEFCLSGAEKVQDVMRSVTTRRRKWGSPDPRQQKGGLC